MATLKKKIQLVFCEVGENSNKVWEGELYDDDTVITRWGRIGNTLDSKTFAGVGESFFLKKEKEKLKKGYTHSTTLAVDKSTTSVVSPKDTNLHKIAHAQLAKKHPQLSALVDRLVAANIHNIVSQTTITYNSVTGLFQTPLGIIRQEGIDQARDMLVAIKKALIDKDSKLPKKVSEYCRVIPQRVSHRFTVESVFPNLDAVEKQSDILDSLEASLKASIVPPPSTTKDDNKLEEKVFEVDLDVLTDAAETRRLEAFYHSSMKSSHGYNHVKIRQMFSVRVGEMDKSFDKTLGNITEVYHGTSQANLLSILKSGIKTSPPNTAYIAGKMFGNGVYGAINSSKSLGYTFGRWGGSSGDSGWLFVCDFAMGKIHEPTRTCSGPPSGYDSIWAKSNKVGLQHDELIVYKNRQVNIKYLLEVK